jgi:transcription antitermination factor NusG
MYKQGKRDAAELLRLRGKYPEDPKWYCVMAHCGQEQKVGDHILSAFPAFNGLEVLLPILYAEPRDGKEKGSGARFLFNGYLFVHCRMSDEIYMGISACKGVSSILGNSYRIPLVMDDQEIATLKRLLKYKPSPVLAGWPKGHAKAMVTGGMLDGLEGRLYAAHEEYPTIAFQLSFLVAESGIVATLPRSQIRIERAQTALHPG